MDKTNHSELALETFFSAQGSKPFHIAQSALWDRELAMDTVQDSMLRLVENYRTRPASEWPALFYTILNNRINDMRRKRMLEQGKHRLVSLTGMFHDHQEQHDGITEYELAADSRNDGITAPESDLVADELKSRISRAVQELSERQRQVFILREWRGMTIQETAEILGCSENSIKQHHFRAMRELRKQLAEVWDHAQPSTP